MSTDGNGQLACVVEFNVGLGDGYAIQNKIRKRCRAAVEDRQQGPQRGCGQLDEQGQCRGLYQGEDGRRERPGQSQALCEESEEGDEEGKVGK